MPDRETAAISGPEPQVLVVDDEPELCRALSKLLTRNGYQVLTAGDGEEALRLLRQHEIHLVLTDLVMPKMGGLDLLRTGKVISPGTEFVIITGHGTIEVAVDAMKLGAYDFVEKPFTSALTLKTVRKAVEKQRLQAENLELRRRLEEVQDRHDIIGRSDVMRQVVETARQVAASTATVLLTGESGTGKEIFADAIHRWSDRRKQALVKVSCAALPETLLEAELFGYEPGAFTGAVGRRTGRFELADRGTLFLDEVGEMSPTTQIKLLRVIQEGTYERLGSSETRTVDVRLLAATNADLAARVQRGQFREDLFYRLNVINLELPPLRNRGEDVILLAHYFLQLYNQKNGKSLGGFTRQAVEALSRHGWPGNVRELENCIERCVVLSKGPFVDVDVLPPTVLAGKSRYEQVVIPVGTPLYQAELQLIEATLHATGGDKETAARILGINARTIYRKLK
ncbi:MAG TPA: sigma-54 dependent transcriptional regulator [Candidatus Krumholzibacteria bacterium]|nr:sigma-54 dependent transcriptional regulator [Candidatus Krumholzibacteria bacterium]HPD71158.1 sigma-54 dependent transcriptional regulator [Candidatus Krumholzibacteria bacterium]HRY39142.1 sigma-54 dependent transcriptional regulator [Candidatus Krumholzibacteria bacterium]